VKPARPPLREEPIDDLEYPAVVAKENEMVTIRAMFRHCKER
jgi:hypothetical protein